MPRVISTHILAVFRHQRPARPTPPAATAVPRGGHIAPSPRPTRPWRAMRLRPRPLEDALAAAVGDAAAAAARVPPLPEGRCPEVAGWGALCPPLLRGLGGAPANAHASARGPTWGGGGGSGVQWAGQRDGALPPLGASLGGGSAVRAPPALIGGAWADAALRAAAARGAREAVELPAAVLGEWRKG